MKLSAEIKDHLVKAHEVALLAVETYNRLTMTNFIKIMGTRVEGISNLRLKDWRFYDL